MKLTREEKEMLDGKYGYPIQRSMEVLVGLGEAYDSEKMVPVVSSHLLALGRPSSKAYCKEMADKGGKFRIFTDSNPMGPDILKSDYVRMGLCPSNSCTPYLVGNAPRFGEHCSWAESSAEPYCNSVLGARTNKDSGLVAMCAALTGRVPEFGLHLDKNRYGNVEVKVTAELKGIGDYGALGYYLGRAVFEGGVPVLTGVSSNTTLDELKHIGGEANFAGSIPLYHVVGVTPEAPTRERAFGPNKPKEILEFTQKELDKANATLSNETNPHVDIVEIGCPHCSIVEIMDIVRLLNGRKVKTEFWVNTAQMVKSLADRAGYTKAIEDAGGKVYIDVCVANPQNELIEKTGPKTIATNGARWADHQPERHMKSHYGNTDQCIEAAISGIWRA